MEESVKGIYLGLLIGLLLVMMYVLRAYGNRYSNERINYLIKEHFNQNGDGTDETKGKRLAVIDVKITSLTQDRVAANIKYHIKDTDITKEVPMVYSLKSSCGYDAHCIQV